MPQKPFNLDAALDEFRADTPSAEARLRARQAFRSRPRRTLRLAAMTGAITLLLLPVAFRTRGSEASALTFGMALRASKAARYVTQTIDQYDAQGRSVNHSEIIWGPNRRVERLFFHNGVPGLENRHVPGLIFKRIIPPEATRRPVNPTWQPYELISHTKDAPGGTEGGAMFESERALMSYVTPLRPIRTEGPYAWFRLSPQETWQVEVETRRIVRRELRDGDGRYVSVFTYPDQVDSAKLDVPPMGNLPRFDIDAERAEMDRLNRDGDRVAKVGGREVKLVGAFQEIASPRQPVYVIFVGKGIARAAGLSGGASTTMRQIPPKIVATVFPTSGPLETLDVEVPVPGTRDYFAFKGVKVRPVSERIRSGLRTPPFE